MTHHALILTSPATLLFHNYTFHCASGKGGIQQNKQEGDGATPVGCFTLKQVFFRPDRLSPPATQLPLVPLSPQDGWCDDPTHADYNHWIKRPHPARHEHLWRDDAIYDIIITTSHNTAPTIPYAGSAIFIHIARPDFTPTQGCIALTMHDLCEILPHLTPQHVLQIPSMSTPHSGRHL